MDRTFAVVGGTGLPTTSDLEDEPIFNSSEFSKGLVARISGFETETELLEYLLDQKPAELKCGREHYLDVRELGEVMQGLALKLKIHGYDDRGERLQYLFSVLSSKYAEKVEIFKIIIQFMIEMSQRPTNVTHLAISSQTYSMEPDEESSIDEDSEKQKALLRQILAEDDDEGQGNEPELKYSSNSTLSDWSTDEEESVEEKSSNDIPPVRKMRHSSSFGEFSDVMENKPDPEVVRQEIRLFWAQERSKAKSFLNKEIRKFDTVALSSQPVISNLLVLQSRFGEFWEWKKGSKEKSDFVAFEEDVVREMLWQFTVCNPISSPVFTEAWKLKSNLMVATLSKSSFAVFVNKYGTVFQKLQHLRQFANFVEKSCFKDSDGKTAPPSKIYRNYASGISEVLRYITKSVSKIERELMRTSRDVSDKSEPACTTLLQLEQKMRSIIEIIDALYEVHSKSIPGSDTVDIIEPWLASIQLISCLETHLLLQTSPSLYGVLLFLFSKCLYALLDDILAALKTLQWDETYSLFIRDAVVRLNDSNFWSDCVKPREFQQHLKSKQITPLMCLEKLLPKLLNILKTCEVLNQLEEDYSKILGNSNIVISDVIDEFLEESFLNFEKLHLDERQNSHSSDCRNEEKIDFIKHFNYIGLGNSGVADCFRFLTSDDHRPTTAATGSMRRYKFEDYVKLSNIPIVAHTVILDKVLSKWFNPFCITAKANIQTIFQDYKVIESMTVFQEIILAVREDFAKAIIDIASESNVSSEYKYEDSLNRNPRFQKLLNECYPEGRVFSVDLKLDPSSDMNCTFIVTPYFPLNLIVTPKSVAGYLFIGRQLHRIRKSLWDVSSLHLKDCRTSEGVDLTRMLMFRFCLINFCSSIRSFFTLKLFCKDFSEFAKSASYEDDLDAIRKIHQDYLESIETRMLRNPLIENIVIRKIVLMCELLRKRWSNGIPQPTMCMLEDTLKKCWQVVNDFKSTKYSFDFNELSYHFGPPPTCL
ncbi:unnamed protein product [Orchesella dallaii]|uniref:Gamma-tubulin complex component n=1 Tax=Orchesella dallaii TaxID=48710 RepID=A0ABP1S5Z5_9HEXA